MLLHQASVCTVPPLRGKNNRNVVWYDQTFSRLTDVYTTKPPHQYVIHRTFPKTDVCTTKPPHQYIIHRAFPDMSETDICTTSPLDHLVKMLHTGRLLTYLKQMPGPLNHRTEMFYTRSLQTCSCTRPQLARFRLQWEDGRGDQPQWPKL